MYEEYVSRSNTMHRPDNVKLVTVRTKSAAPQKHHPLQTTPWLPPLSMPLLLLLLSNVLLLLLLLLHYYCYYYNLSIC